MDLRQLEILRAIAESGSFTAAGARLHVSQSAISRQVLLLEEEFKEPLFIRFGRRIQITPTGETLLQLSHRVFADIRDTSRKHSRHEEEAVRHAASGRRHDGVPLRVPDPAEGVPTAASGRRHQGDHRRHAAPAAQAAVGRRRSRPADAADRRRRARDRAGDPRGAAARDCRRAIGWRAARPSPRPRSCGSRSSCSRAARTRAGSSTNSSSAPTSSRASSPRPRTSKSSSRWSRPASASASCPFQSVAREIRGGSLAVARIEGRDAGARDRLGPPAGRIASPRMVREMMDTLTRILPRLKLAPPGQKRRGSSREARAQDGSGPHASASGE